jgi:hypothetical protein
MASEKTKPTDRSDPEEIEQERRDSEKFRLLDMMNILHR